MSYAVGLLNGNNIFRMWLCL